MSGLPAKLSVGVIGIGAFGSKIALRLLWTDFPGLQIYDCDDLTPRFFANNYGGLNVGSPKMMAQNCDVIITALPSAAQLREVCFGWQGLATGFKTGGIVLDVGLTDPLETVALAKELETHGVTLVDAPAFGTPDDAKEGKLTLLVGGSDAAVERCRPVLDKLGSRVKGVKALAPTRPHPSAPDTPPGDLLMGPVVGLFDRLRDAASKRGTQH